MPDSTLLMDTTLHSYAELMPPGLLIQSKSETHLIESNNMPQRHWFGRFRRKTCIVSRGKRMVGLTVMLYAKFHVNGMYDYGWLKCWIYNYCVNIPRNITAPKKCHRQSQLIFSHSYKTTNRNPL